MDVQLSAVRVIRGGRLVLEVPELVLRAGGVTAILGPNGAGKTTLLRLIAGLERPTAGTVSVGGREVGHEGGSVAFAFQKAVFLSGTVERNMDLALDLREIPRDERRERILQAVGALGVDHLLKRDTRGLSGGEAQRLNLARALMLRAPVLLLDEPLSGLDAPSRESLMRELPVALRSYGEATIAMVTHDRDEAARLSDDVVLLLGGQLHAAGRTADVFARPPDAESARFLGWTVIEIEGRAAGVAPGALQVGDGDIELEMEVEAVIPAGAHWEAIGTVHGSPARVSGTGQPPGMGGIAVFTRRSDLVEFGG